MSTLIYLPSAALMAYVTNWSEKVERNGRIDGLLLSGLGIDGIDLIGRYVDRTADCQSASLLLSLFPQSLPDPRVQDWIEKYFLVLNVVIGTC